MHKRSQAARVAEERARADREQRAKADAERAEAEAAEGQEDEAALQSLEQAMLQMQGGLRCGDVDQEPECADERVLQPPTAFGNMQVWWTKSNDSTAPCVSSVVRTAT